MSSSPAQDDTPACQARLALGHALHDAAVFQHDVMRRDVGAGGAELRDRAFHIRHAGVVQHDHVGQAALVAVAIIRRRDDVGGDRGIRGESLHVRVGPGDGEGALTLRINTSSCERTERHMKTQTGQENGNTTSFETRTAFTIPLPDAVRAIAAAALRFAFWPSVCGGASPAAPAVKIRAKVAGPSLIPINAFLTLTAVTKW